MKGILQRCQDVYSLLCKRWQCYIATSPDEINECHNIRKIVFGYELRRLHHDPTYNPGGDELIDHASSYLVCKDRKKNKIIGFCRITPAHLITRYDTCREIYQLYRFPDSLQQRIWIVSRYAFLPQYRKTLASLVIMQSLYHHALSFGCPLSISVCEPIVFHFYKRIGYHAIDKIQPSPFGGFRIPIAIVPQDINYFKKINSPLYRYAQKIKYPEEKLGLLWWYNCNLQPHSIGFKLVDDSDIDLDRIILFENISKHGRKLLTKNSILIECNVDDNILKQGSGDRMLGMIYHGEVNIIRYHKVIATLKAGDWFGELGHLLYQPNHDDLIVCQNQTQIILFSLSILKNLSNTKDKSELWKNLCYILANKMKNTLETSPPFRTANEDRNHDPVIIFNQK